MADNTIGQLDSVYVQLINSTLEMERKPLTRITTQKDSITVQRAVYTDVRNRLNALKDATKTLISTDAFYGLNPGRKTALSNTFVTATGLAWSGSILTATASTSALPASYTLKIDSVAKEHRVYSKQFDASDQALGLSGSFTLGGELARSIAPVAGDSTIANASATAALGIGQKDLESGDYYIETRNDATAGWQFRVVDAKGNAVKIQLTDGSGYATDWQNIPTAPEGSTDPIAYDTGRGFKFSFGADPSAYTERSRGNGATKISYTAQGASISIAATDTLENIASKINSASYADGQDVLATIVDRQLVLTSKQTGLAHAIKAHDGAEGLLNAMEIYDGAAFMHVMQPAADASFTVNNLRVTRSTNTNLTDVIAGVTLNLTAEAEGKTTTLSINSDSTAQRKTIDSFLNSFKDLQNYLSGKLAVTKQTDGTYKRGALSGDDMFASLRLDLARVVNAGVDNSGIFKNLRQIGLELNDNFELTVANSTKLEDALKNNFSDVQKILDKVMTDVDKKLARFTGEKSYVDQAIKTIDDQTKLYNDQISSWNDRLDKRKEALYTQYAELQSQIVMMTYTQQQMNLIYSTMSSSY